MSLTLWPNFLAEERENASAENLDPRLRVVAEVWSLLGEPGTQVAGAQRPVPEWMIDEGTAFPFSKRLS